ncbi:BufA2 family periplasmic bufferin-type metallophore [Kaarinaea lacus]
MRASKTTNIAMAVAAASLFAFAPMSATHAEEANVKCFGVNKCKGHNDCKSANNACKGQGSCKGQSFVLMSEKACDHVGGKVGS